MNTIIGTIHDSTDTTCPGLTIFFEPLSTPIVVPTPIVVSNQRVQCITITDGSFSIELDPGIYQVTITSSPETYFQITVPTGTATIDIGTIITSTIPPSPVIPPYFYFGGNVRIGASGNLEVFNFQSNMWNSLVNYGIPAQAGWGPDIAP